MKICDTIHRLRIDFAVTPEIKRFVYIYLIEGRDFHLVDTGVKGTERRVAEYLHGLGRDVADIKTIFLTHSHPDHIGAAHALQRMSGAKVYACRGEKEWIEDIDGQYAARPIPNFYTLVDTSAAVDVCLEDGDSVTPEEGISIRALQSAGHSQASLSFYYAREQALFCGDAIPVQGDIPIFVSLEQSMATLESFLRLRDVSVFLPAWDDIYSADRAKEVVSGALDRLGTLRRIVRETIRDTPQASIDAAVDHICGRLRLRHLAGLPVFRSSLAAAILESSGAALSPPQF